jgi:hypothetical protein
VDGIIAWVGSPPNAPPACMYLPIFCLGVNPSSLFLLSGLRSQETLTEINNVDAED